MRVAMVRSHTAQQQVGLPQCGGAPATFDGRRMTARFSSPLSLLPRSVSVFPSSALLSCRRCAAVPLSRRHRARAASAARGYSTASRRCAARCAHRSTALTRGASSAQPQTDRARRFVAGGVSLSDIRDQRGFEPSKHTAAGRPPHHAHTAVQRCAHTRTVLWTDSLASRHAEHTAGTQQHSRARSSAHSAGSAVQTGTRTSMHTGSNGTERIRRVLRLCMGSQ